MSLIRRSCRTLSDHRKQLSAATILACLTAPDAHAHAIVGTSAAWWDGMMHVFYAPLAWAGMVALAACLVRSPPGIAFSGVIAATLAAVLASIVAPMMPSALLAAIGTAIAGALGAMAIRLDRNAAMALGAACGISVGFAAVDSEVLSPLMTLGLGLAVLVAAAILMRAMELLYRLQPVAPRVVSAWAGAIALMMALLSLQR